jgi:hypothetical protein
MPGYMSQVNLPPYRCGYPDLSMSSANSRSGLCSLTGCALFWRIRIFNISTVTEKAMAK